MKKRNRILQNGGRQKQEILFIDTKLKIPLSIYTALSDPAPYRPWWTMAYSHNRIYSKLLLLHPLNLSQCLGNIFCHSDAKCWWGNRDCSIHNPTANRREIRNASLQILVKRLSRFNRTKFTQNIPILNIIWWHISTAGWIYYIVYV